MPTFRFRSYKLHSYRRMISPRQRLPVSRELCGSERCGQNRCIRFGVIALDVPRTYGDRANKQIAAETTDIRNFLSFSDFSVGTPSVRRGGDLFKAITFVYCLYFGNKPVATTLDCFDKTRARGVITESFPSILTLYVRLLSSTNRSRQMVRINSSFSRRRPAFSISINSVSKTFGVKGTGAYRCAAEPSQRHPGGSRQIRKTALFAATYKSSYKILTGNSPHFQEFPGKKILG